MRYRLSILLQRGQLKGQYTVLQGGTCLPLRRDDDCQRLRSVAAVSGIVRNWSRSRSVTGVTDLLHRLSIDPSAQRRQQSHLLLAYVCPVFCHEGPQENIGMNPNFSQRVSYLQWRIAQPEGLSNVAGKLIQERIQSESFLCAFTAAAEYSKAAPCSRWLCRCQCSKYATAVCFTGFHNSKRSRSQTVC